jgi:predicted RNA binding protein YcfA (HicA-like mRNA interferase family)
MNGFEKDVKALLTQHGWQCYRAAKGSHEYWSKQGHKPITVPHGCKSRHLANQILKQAGINHKF